LRKIEINSKVESGKLTKNKRLIADAIANFEGKEISLTIKKKQSNRSNPQNSYYWGVVIAVIKSGLYDATGEIMTSDQIHYELLLPKFAPDREIVNKETGEVFTQKITSSAMTKNEFSVYIEAISKFASEFLNVQIPSSEDEISLNY